MALKLPKLSAQGQSEFRNELICFIDPKYINLDRTLVNLYPLLRHNGTKPRGRSQPPNFMWDLDKLESRLLDVEKIGQAEGIGDNSRAVRGWLRTNLMDMVSRGKGPELEKFTALKPIHLLSYLLRNQRQNRDYLSSEQVYSLLTVNQSVRDSLKQYLGEGWDELMKRTSDSKDLDIDSLGLLRLIEPMALKDAPGNDKAIFNYVRPLLMEEAQLFCDDVRHLLEYRKVIPRHVLLDYLKTLTGFHLSLYLLKLVRYVPQLVQTAKLPTDRSLDIVIDLTDDPMSVTGQISADDATQLYDSLPDYIRSVFSVNLALASRKLDRSQSENLHEAVTLTSKPTVAFQAYCLSRLNDVGVPEGSEDLFAGLTQFEDDDVNQFLAVVMHVRGAFYNRFHTDMLDSVLQRNADSGLLAAGKTRKARRRFVLGTKLLETLVQLSVLNSNFKSEPVSIEEFTSWLYNRYGLIVNGLEHPRYADSDIRTHLGFSRNVEALKDKLRRIGFYTQLSDAYLLQKIRPRYEIL